MSAENHWTKVVNLVKTKTMETNNQNSKWLIGSKLLADMKNGQNLSKWEPELCIKMLKIPGVNNYSVIKKLIQKASK